MSTVEERFSTMESDAHALVKLASNLYDLGIYGSQDQAALTVLLTTVTGAMRILDPDKTRDFYDMVLKERTPKVNAEFSAGSYL